MSRDYRILLIHFCQKFREINVLLRNQFHEIFLRLEIHSAVEK